MVNDQIKLKENEIIIKIHWSFFTAIELDIGYSCQKNIKCWGRLICAGDIPCRVIWILVGASNNWYLVCIYLFCKVYAVHGARYKYYK